MRIITLHSDFIEFEPKMKALKGIKDIEMKKQKIEECLVVLVAAEESDKNIVGTSEKTANEIEDVAMQVKCKKIVLYPYVHLTSEPAQPYVAKELISNIEKLLKDKKFEVNVAPFGYYKAFTISVKGHPLAELSREVKEIEGEKHEEKAKEQIKEEFWIMGTDGKLYKPEDYEYKKNEQEFKMLVEKEALKKELKGGDEPEYIKHLKRFGVDWEPMSDLGHMRFNPQGNLIFELISDYSLHLANSLGIPVYSLRGTNMFNLAEKAVKEHADLYGDRLYEVHVENKKFVMRYAACHQQFAIMKDWIISHKDLPFGAFEVADSYRMEQSGELLLCFRCRKLHMPDLHILCYDENMAKEWALTLHQKIYDEFGKLGRDLVCLHNTTKEYFENNREFFKKLVKIEKKPILLRFLPEGKYYWKINVEHHIIDEMKRPREIGTWQIDFGNAQRFGIKFMDKDNMKKYPLIIHTAIIGTIERYIYAIFDTALKQKNPVLPLWLSPTQIRLCPVNDSFISYCEQIADKLSKQNIRVDIDDRIESVQKKIRSAEMEWIPMILVIGNKEKEKEIFTVRFREDGSLKEMKLKEIVKQIKNKTKDYPFKPLPLPRLLSKRPVFVG